MKYIPFLKEHRLSNLNFFNVTVFVTPLIIKRTHLINLVLSCLQNKLILFAANVIRNWQVQTRAPVSQTAPLSLCLLLALYELCIHFVVVFVFFFVKLLSRAVQEKPIWPNHGVEKGNVYRATNKTASAALVNGVRSKLCNYYSL